MSTNEPAERLRAAIDELPEAFPVDEISDAPWVVERGSIAWMIREGEKGPQVGNFLLEADARWVAATRNALAAERAIGATALSVLHLSWAIDDHAMAMAQEPIHDGGTCTTDCAGDIRARYLARLTRERNGQ